jgi:hypothetical protein
MWVENFYKLYASALMLKKLQVHERIPRALVYPLMMREEEWSIKLSALTVHCQFL